MKFYFYYYFNYVYCGYVPMSAGALRNPWGLELQVVARWVLRNELQFLQEQCVLPAEPFLQAPQQKL